MLHIKRGSFNHKVAGFIILSLFFPYVKAYGHYRIDQFILGLFILLLPYFLLNVRSNNSIYTFAILSLFSYVFLIIRVLNGFVISNFALQILNQYSYFLSAVGLHLFFKKIKIDYLKIFNLILILSIFVNFYGIIQLIFRQTVFINFINSYYSGGLQQTIDISKIAESLSNQRATSIFVQPSSYGIFNLVVFAIGIGIKNIKGSRLRVLIALVFSLIGGILSATKTFYFGFVLFYLIYSFFNKRFYAKGLVKHLMIGVLLTTLLVVEMKYFPYIRYLLQSINDYGIGSILDTRFGNVGGYLSNNFQIIKDNAVIGVGLDASNYTYADSMVLMVLLLGGGLFFILFYAGILFLIFKSLRLRSMSNMHRAFSALNIVFLLISIAFPIFIQARITPIFLLINLYLLSETTNSKEC